MTIVEREIEVTIEVPAEMPVIFDPRVERGAALLDERLEGWIDHIDLERLNLESQRSCVLGQIGMCIYHEEYNETVIRHFRDLLPEDYIYAGGSPFEQDHGFWAAEDEDGEWDEADGGLLENDWRLLIAYRQSRLTSA